MIMVLKFHISKALKCSKSCEMLLDFVPQALLISNATSTKTNFESLVCSAKLAFPVNSAYLSV